MNIIQLLKKNEKPLCLLSSEMQDFILGCKAEDLEYLSSESGRKSPDWRTNANSPDEIKRATIDTYRLHPDYEDEPEIEECEIVDRNNVLSFSHEGWGIHNIGDAVAHPDFVGFKFENGKIRSVSTVYGKPNITTTQFYEIDESDLGDCEVLHATHVLMRKRLDK